MVKNKHIAFWTLAVVLGLCPPASAQGTGGFGKNQTLDQWIKQLEEGGPTERLNAVNSIAQLGPEAEPAVPALVKALQNEKVDNVGIAILRTLRRIGPCPAAERAVPSLVMLLANGKSQVRHAAADTLGALGPHTKEAVPALIACLRSQDRDLRGKCAFALGATQQADSKVLHALGAALTDPEIYVRTQAIAGLGKLGRPGVPLLIQYATSKNVKPNKKAAFPVGGFDPGVPSALKILAELGPQAVDAVAGLITLLGHWRSDYRADAAKALGAIGPAAKDALPTLERMRREDGQAGQDAADAIKKIQRAE